MTESGKRRFSDTPVPIGGERGCDQENFLKEGPSPLRTELGQDIQSQLSPSSVAIRAQGSRDIEDRPGSPLMELGDAIPIGIAVGGLTDSYRDQLLVSLARNLGICHAEGDLKARCQPVPGASLWGVPKYTDGHN